MCGYCFLLGLASGMAVAVGGLWLWDRWADWKLAQAPDPLPAETPVVYQTQVEPKPPVPWHCYLHGPVLVFHQEIDMVEHMAHHHPNHRRFGDWWIPDVAAAVPKA